VHKPFRGNVGHIGYDIRPSARQRGYATAMLAAVPIARAAGHRFNEGHHVVSWATASTAA
jgi:predicted acetyltransferase